MRTSILLVTLVISMNALANEGLEPSWKAKLRGVITQVAGVEWSTKLLGDAPKEEVKDVPMPEIPKLVKKSTDVESYTKQVKAETEFDKLPAERKKHYDYKFLEELFQVTRKAEAKDEDLANWLNTLSQGGSREGIYQALVLDEVYSSLESMEEAPSQKLLTFCLGFSEKFLNQTFKQESLKDLNLYSLKRIFTEKGLDLLEHYEVHDLDKLNRWYANFSSDLAKNYSPLLKPEIRSEESPEYHYKWAQSMPVQHIKSEFIIKLHSVMNGLQLIN